MEKLLFILGPTASSKSKTSINACLKYPFEIINTDVFACYKGRGVMTAKPSEKDQELVKHHIINFLDYENNTFNILDYKKLFANSIKEIYDKSKIPLIVGGTNYYVEQSIFKKEHSLDLQSDEFKNTRKSDFIHKTKTLFEEKQVSEYIYKHIMYLINLESHEDIESYMRTVDETIKRDILKYVDHLTYKLLHQNDQRKIENALIFFFKNYYEKSKDNEAFKRELINTNTYIIYLNPSKENISNRITKRLKEMIYEEGGFYEVFEVFNYFLKIVEDIDKIDFKIGFLQAIGYKEYFPLVKKIITNEKMKEEIQNCNNSEDLFLFINKYNLKKDFEDCFERSNISTFQYAKSQKKFIEKRIIPFINTSQLLIVDPFCDNFATQVNLFIENRIMNNNLDTFVFNNTITTNQNIVEEDKSSQIFSCDDCGIESIINKKVYKEHIKSKSHMYNVKNKKIE